VHTCTYIKPKSTILNYLLIKIFLISVTSVLVLILSEHLNYDLDTTPYFVRILVDRRFGIIMKSLFLVGPHQTEE
jgi:hypothetical protein